METTLTASCTTLTAPCKEMKLSRKKMETRLDWRHVPQRNLHENSFDSSQWQDAMAQFQDPHQFPDGYRKKRFA
jgi:hypothetical protein